MYWSFGLLFCESLRVVVISIINGKFWLLLPVSNEV